LAIVDVFVEDGKITKVELNGRQMGLRLIADYNLRTASEDFRALISTRDRRREAASNSD
jgi:hypothetical protein